MPARPLRLCLIMHSTRSDNLGVGALTIAEVAILRDAAEAAGRRLEFTAMDWPDAREPYLKGPDIRILPMNTKVLANPFGYFATARRSDIVIDIGAGDSFTDIYGSKRLSRMLAMKFLTHLAGTPLVVAPQTIGPFARSLSRRLARWTLARSAVVATRDALSTAAVRELGLTREVIEASDVALLLPFDQPPPRPEGGPVRVGLNVSGLLMKGGYTGRNEFGIAMDYPALMRELIRFFQGEGAEVHLVPHVLPDDPTRYLNEDDSAASDALAGEFPGLLVAPRFVSPSEAKSYIAGMDFFLGARMHACIAAFSSGVPVVPMAYSRKFEGLFGSLGYPHTVDCTVAETDAVFDKIVAAFESRAALAQEIEAALARGQDKLSRYVDALERLLRTLP